MGVLCVGDLIRWKNPLYLVENGKEIEVGSWHHAIVVKITEKTQIFDEAPGNRITLMLIGPAYPSRCLDLSAEMFFEIGQIQKIMLGEWVYTTRV